MSPHVKTSTSLQEEKTNSSVLGTETNVYIYSWNNLHLWEKESFVFLLLAQVSNFFA